MAITPTKYDVIYNYNDKINNKKRLRYALNIK